MKKSQRRPSQEELAARTAQRLGVPLRRMDGKRIRDLSMAHHVNLDAIAKGEAGEEILWQYVGGALTWSCVAERLQAGVPEMAAQLEVVRSLIDRYRRTGRVGLTGPELQIARDGLSYMDQLAELVPHVIAIEAAEASEAMVQRLADGLATA